MLKRYRWRSIHGHPEAVGNLGPSGRTYTAASVKPFGYIGYEIDFPLVYGLRGDSYRFIAPNEDWAVELATWWLKREGWEEDDSSYYVKDHPLGYRPTG